MSLATLLAAKDAVDQKLLDAMTADITVDAIGFRPDATGSNTVQRAAYIKTLTETSTSLQQQIIWARYQQQGAVSVYTVGVVDG